MNIRHNPNHLKLKPAEGELPTIVALAHSPAIGGAEFALASLMESTHQYYRWHIVFTSTIPPHPAIVKHAHKISSLELPWWCYEAHDSPPLITKAQFDESLNSLRALAGEADLLLTNTITIPWLGFISAELGKPHVWYIHEFGDIDHNLKFIAGYKESLSMIDECSERILTISTALKQHLGQVIPLNKIDIIHQSIKLGELTKIGIKPPADKLRLLSIGAIKPSKGQHIALGAYEFLNKEEFTLDIIGPSADQKYVQELKDMTVKINGASLKVRRYDVVKEMKDHDIVLMCSQNEALGRITIEALAAGKIVIGYNCPSTKVLLSDGRGILYEPNTPQALSLVLKNKALFKNINPSSNRLYVSKTFSIDKQRSDFNHCVTKSLGSRSDGKKPGLLESYTATLESRQLFISNRRRFYTTSRTRLTRLLPDRLKKLIKSLIS